MDIPNAPGLDLHGGLHAGICMTLDEEGLKMKRPCCFWLFCNATIVSMQFCGCVRVDKCPQWSNNMF